MAWARLSAVEVRRWLERLCLGGRLESVGMVGIEEGLPLLVVLVVGLGGNTDGAAWRDWMVLFELWNTFDVFAGFI